jgi:hypothetical protein
MVMTLQDISDRFEIMDLLTSYASAIDNYNLDALDTIFCKDAQIDFSKAGGPRADLPTIKQFLKENLGVLPRQHMISNFQIQINRDEAKVRCLCFNPLELAEKHSQIMLWGLWYNDICIRSDEGWRIKEKTTEPCYHWNISICNQPNPYSQANQSQNPS